MSLDGGLGKLGLLHSKFSFDDSNPGSGGGSPTDPPEDQTKTLTQKELDDLIEKRLARERKAAQREIQASAEKAAELEAKLKELQEKIDQSKLPTDPPKDVQGQIELLQAKHQREIEAMTAKVAELATTAAKEKELRERTERDKLLQEALQKAHCTDLLMGTRFFLPQIVMDPVDGWMYTTKSGNIVSIEDGVAEEMPAYLKPSDMVRGGSGALNGSPAKISEKRKILEQEEKKLEKVEKEARLNPRNSSLIVQANQQKRKVETLRKELLVTK